MAWRSDTLAVPVPGNVAGHRGAIPDRPYLRPSKAARTESPLIASEARGAAPGSQAAREVPDSVR